jgi:hypothetical protein
MVRVAANRCCCIVAPVYGVLHIWRRPCLWAFARGVCASSLRVRYFAHRERAKKRMWPLLEVTATSLSTRMGIRTPVAALKGLSPSPLDDAGLELH